MGNQQVSEVAKAWLGGLLDGEGSIFVGIQRERREIVKMAPLVTITNTDAMLINVAANIYKQLKIGAYIKHKYLSHKNKNHQDQYILTVGGFKRIEKCLSTMLPYLVAKHPQAELMLRFVRHRLSLPASPRSKQRYYRDWEIETAAMISKLNHKAHLRDYTPDFLNFELEDIVRADAKASEWFRNELPPEAQLALWSDEDLQGLQK